jgi:hypothetical protein
MPQRAEPNNVGAFSREHRGQKGLAKWLGEHDPSATTIASEANDNRPRRRLAGPDDCRPMGRVEGQGERRNAQILHHDNH